MCEGRSLPFSKSEEVFFANQQGSKIVERRDQVGGRGENVPRVRISVKLN